MRRPRFIFLFSLFSGAACLDEAAGHLGLSAFSSFQGCTWLRWGGRTPLPFLFFYFSAVLPAWMRRPDTSVFPLFPLFRGAHGYDGAAGHLGLSAFPLFRGAHGCDEAAGHLGLSAFSSFQGCTWLRWGGRTPRSLCFFLFSGVLPSLLQIGHSPSQKFVPAKQDANRSNRSPSPLLLPSIPSMGSRTIHQFPCQQTFL